MPDNKIIVTGGMGFIGSHTVIELYNAGYAPVIIDNLSNSDISILKRIEDITGKSFAFEQIDLSDAQLTNSVFEKHRDANGVIHFAALKAVGESVDKPVMYYRNNILSLINVIDASAKYDIKNFIFSSSCTVYGQPDVLPVTENSPVVPAASPYGATKQMSEEILKDSSKALDHFKVISLRYFNPIGAHKSGKLGELPLGVPKNLMPYITQTAIGLRANLSVFGNDYDTPDGTAIRDYIHVVDLAKAHIAAHERLSNDRNESDFEVYNIGVGKGFSVLDVIHSFERSTGVKCPFEFSPRRQGDIVMIYADTQLAEEKLQWKAEKNLDEMTSSAWAWQKEIGQFSAE